MPRETDKHIQLSNRLVLGSYYGLIVSLLFNSLAMTTGFTITTLVIWLLQTLPLALFAPGLHRGNARAGAWLSFVVLMYFTHGVLVAFTPGRLLTGSVIVLFCSLLFIALILFIRRRGNGGSSSPTSP